MGKTKNNYKKKNRRFSTILPETDAVRNLKINTLPQTNFSNTFHMLGMIMPLLSTMTLFIIFMVNAKWIAVVSYLIGLILLLIPSMFSTFSERLNTGSFRDNPFGFPNGLNFGASVYNFAFLINSLFPGFGMIKTPTIDSSEFWTTFLIITAFMIMDMVHKIGFKNTKGLIRLNLGTDNTTLLVQILFTIPIVAATAVFTSGAYAAENFNTRELFYLQESYSDKKCSPCEQKNAIIDARQEILRRIDAIE